MDCSLPGSSFHEVLQARILEWVAISFSRGSSDPGIEPGSPALESDALTSEPPRKPFVVGLNNFNFKSYFILTPLTLLLFLPTVMVILGCLYFV